MTTPFQPVPSFAHDGSLDIDKAQESASALVCATESADGKSHPSNHTNEIPSSMKVSGTTSTLEKLKKTRTQYAKLSWGSFVKENKPPLFHYGSYEKVVRLSDHDWGTPENWFILGDMHGDFYALSNALQYIVRTCPDFRLIFLGDLIDRGPHPMECLWLLLAYAKRFPDRILWIAGNHDIAVHENEDGSFWGSVLPSEFLDHLNRVDSWTPFRREFGREFVELVKDLPRAVLFPDGLLITHGGFPLVDRHKDIPSTDHLSDKISWLNSPQSLQDFTWTRITRYPKRIPNRASTGCSYGFNDFAAFCEATKDFFPTSRLVTGHDHPTDGFDLHPEWKVHAALTLKGYGFSEDYDRPDAYLAKYQKHLVVGRCRRDQIPEPIKIPVIEADLTEYFNSEISALFKDSQVGGKPPDPTDSD